MSRLRLSILGARTLGTSFLGWGPAVDPPQPPAPIVVPTDELVSWVAERLGVDVYPNQLPQLDQTETLLSYHIIDGSSVVDLGGATSTRWWNLQFDAWGPRSSDCLLLQQRLYALLGTYRGPVGLAFCQVAIPGRPMTSYEDMGNGSGQGVYRAMQEWKVCLNG